MEITLTITLDAQGKVHISGPLEQPGLCVKMIGEGLKALGQFTERQQKSVIQPARIMPIGLGVKQ